MPKRDETDSLSDAGADESREEHSGGDADGWTHELLSRRRLLSVSGVALASSLAGCPRGGDSTDTPPETDSPTDTDTPTSAPTATAAPTSAPTPTATPAEAETPTDTETPTETETETETETPEPTMEPVFDEFVAVDGTDFVVGGETFYPVGGNHPQLRKQSERQQRAWIDDWTNAVGPTNVLRGVAFGTGTSTPTDPLQPSPGEAGEAAFEKLDRMIALCGEAGIRLILPLTNYWDWMGGIPQYLDWGNLDQKHEFYTDEQAQEWYRSHIENVLTRTNTYTGIEYRNDPTIMMWELCNEPSVDASLRTDQTLQGFYDWVADTAQYIKDLDSNHLVSTGMADPYPWDDETLNRRAHEQDGIDAYSIHLWADPEHSDIGISRGTDRIAAHAAHARELDQPIYMGEYGWSIERLTDDPAEKYSIEYRNIAFEEFLTAMREEGYDGSLVWDFRHSQEGTVSWNEQAVFPGHDSTTSLLTEQYSNFSAPPGESAGPTFESPSLSTATEPLDGLKTAQVPDTGGGTGDEPAFSVAPEGDTYSDPDGTNTSTDPSDVSAEFYLGYDDGALYVRAEVTDDTHEAISGSDMWQQDSVQIAVGESGAYGPEYGVSHARGSPSVHRWLGGAARADASNVDASTSRDGSTTTYDLTFPWETLFSEDRGGGDTFPFSVQINDNDESDEQRNNVLGWTLPGINGVKQVSELGVLVLESEGAVWDAQVGDGPADLSTGETGTWTFSVSNYGDSAHEFDVSLDGTDAATSLEVPGNSSATITVEGSFSDTGSADVAVTVTDGSTGESETLSQSVTIT